MMTRKFETTCNECGVRILMVQSGRNWKPLDYPDHSIDRRSTRHRCQSEDFEEWFDKHMGSDLGGKF